MLFVPTEPVLDQIAQVYDYLTAPAKERLAEGIGIAAGDLPNAPVGVKTLRELAHLCGFIATPQALSRLVDRIDDPGFLSSVGAEEKKETYALLLNIAAGLTPASAAKATLMRLITSPGFALQFEPDYAPMAFDALVRAEPEQIAGHLATLDRTLHLDTAPDESLDAVVASVLSQVDTEALTPQMRELSKISQRLTMKILDKHELPWPDLTTEGVAGQFRISRRQPEGPWVDIPDGLFNFEFASVLGIWHSSRTLASGWPIPPHESAAAQLEVAAVAPQINELVLIIVARHDARASSGA